MSDIWSDNKWLIRRTCGAEDSRAKRILDLPPSIILFALTVGYLRRTCWRASPTAHALVGAGVLTAPDAEAIEKALQKILDVASNNTDYFNDSSAEDIHSFVESKLVELTGDLGRKLHTGRSRNDQVATDFRLWLRRAIDNLTSQLQETQKALLEFAEVNRDVVIPGYTHLQRAQPVLLAHWCLAYFEMLSRDQGAFEGRTPSREYSATRVCCLGR